MIKNFNIIEISLNRENTDFIIIALKLKSDRFHYFVGKNAMIELLEFLKNPRLPKKLYFHSFEPTFFFIQLLKIIKDLSKIKYFAARTSIYSFSFNVDEKTIFINNTCHLFMTDFDNYTVLPYWQTGLSEIETKYTLDPIYKNWVAKEAAIKDYLHLWLHKDIIKPRTSEPTTLLPKEVKAILKKNLIHLNHELQNFDKNIKLILPDWSRKITASSIAKKIFEYKFNSHNLEIINTLETDSIIRTSYFGGRCEVFGNPYLNHEKVYHFDFPNMYGTLMLDSFPTESLILLENVSDFKIDGFYYITINSNNDLPVLPLKYPNFARNGEFLIESSKFDEINQNMIFCNGRLEGLFPRDEILLSISEGSTIEKIHFAWVFSGRDEFLFKDFAENLINFRKNYDRKIWKSILVSFYGKLGMKPLDSEVKIWNHTNYANLKNQYDILKEVWSEGVCFASVKRDIEKVDSLVQYAALITSRGRVKSYKTIKGFEKNEGRVLYVDTDGFFVAYPKEKNIINQTHGVVTWEKQHLEKEIEDAVFASTRTYSVKYKNGEYETKIAGIKRNSISFENFKANFYTDTQKSYPSSFRIEKSSFDIFSLREWNTFNLVNLHSYSKRCFSPDKKKTNSWFKLNDELIKKT